MANKVQGEGDYEAARRYRSDVENIVRTADIERASRDAAPRDERGRWRRWPLRRRRVVNVRTGQPQSKISVSGELIDALALHARRASRSSAQPCTTGYRATCRPPTTRPAGGRHSRNSRRSSRGLLEGKTL